MKNYTGTFICSSIYDVDFKPESFHTIVSFETLEHLDEPVFVLNLFHQWLCHGGRLILSIPLNHPDRVYHKRVYSYPGIREMFDSVGCFSLIGEFQQNHLSITPVETDMLDAKSTGTYLGIWEKR